MSIELNKFLNKNYFSSTDINQLLKIPFESIAFLIGKWSLIRPLIANFMDKYFEWKQKYDTLYNLYSETEDPDKEQIKNNIKTLEDRFSRLECTRNEVLNVRVGNQTFEYYLDNIIFATDLRRGMELPASYIGDILSINSLSQICIHINDFINEFWYMNDYTSGIVISDDSIWTFDLKQWRQEANKILSEISYLPIDEREEWEILRTVALS